MKPCTAVRAGRIPLAGFGAQIQPRRWRSTYDKSTLTPEALLEQVESQLGNNVDGTPIRVDIDAKTVATAAGALPISPLMDPAWIKGKRRATKNKPTTISGQFRKKLSNNPFAQALMTPIRFCKITKTHIPRYFLQDLEVVQHPENPSQHWVMPGPLAFHNVVPIHHHRSQPPTDRGLSNDSATKEDGSNPTAEPAPKTSETPTRERHIQAPLTTYCLARKEVLDSTFDVLSHQNTSRRLQAMLHSTRTGMASVNIDTKKVRFRPEMGDLILKRQRRTVIDALVYRAEKSRLAEWRYVQPVKSWDEVRDIEKRGCVLWLGNRADAKKDAFATLDVQDVRWWRKMPVHNLTWLLGEEGVKELCESSVVFRDNDLVVLKLWRSESVRKLHLLLWRMHGYLAEGDLTRTKADDNLADDNSTEETEALTAAD